MMVIFVFRMRAGLTLQVSNLECRHCTTWQYMYCTTNSCRSKYHNYNTHIVYIRVILCSSRRSLFCVYLYIAMSDDFQTATYAAHSRPTVKPRRASNVYRLLNIIPYNRVLPTP